MQPLRLCVFLAFIAVLRCYELSQNLAEFYCVVNGYCGDREQVEKDGVQRTLVDIPVLYLEHCNNGVLVPPLLLIVTEGEDGIVFITQYNFSGNTQIKPQTFDVYQIKSFTMANLQGQQDCKTSYQRFPLESAPSNYVCNCDNTSD